MNLSIREQAMRVVSKRLAGSGTPATGGVFRARLYQIAQDELPCYDYTASEGKVEDPGEYGDRFSVTHTVTFVVRAIVDAAVQEGQGQPGATATPIDDSALDPFYVFAVQQLIGADTTLGGLVMEVAEISDTTVFQPQGKDQIGLEMTFEMKFASKRGDPTQKG